MHNNKVRDIINKVIDAHGGVSRWMSITRLEANISAWGLLFKAKRRPTLNRVWVAAEIDKPNFTFFDFPRTGQMSELIGEEEVRILDSDKKILVRRSQPRKAFRGLRRQLYWDVLDFVYFGGYATWNYLVTPFLFLREDFQIEELTPLTTSHGTYLRLQVQFPAALPTHCKTQVFYFDENYLLRRLDYTAEVVGRWARAAHTCGKYKTFDGFNIPTRRRVRPLVFRYLPLQGPILVALDIHDVRAF